ncbi:altered inheritance of mitochondria protein 24, mitochondrial [[Candida] jaroonii]|uniref:Altered inheritance of mitochondria protein 24, mitochondrial n=1 Tax=[Candida] jaroonii TaxID=467808 RepID=A0ACA9Y8W2_9ASCO|nr:altered inheritance of mitochondria protein 24, mitochondrial [[Candida] jaroonii]
MRFQVRSISISTNNNLIKTGLKTSTEASNIKNVSKLDFHESPEIKSINNSILSIELPPSIPISIKKGSLISIYGISNLSISSISNQLDFKLSDVFYGDFNLIFSRIISTSKISMLISSNRSKIFNFNKISNTNSISMINLDGTNDWALLNQSNLQFKIGNSLILSNYLKPKFISKKSARSQGLSRNEMTGLRSKFIADWLWPFNKTFKLISGRGQIGIIGKGSIYNINLVENEEVLINKDSLLAVSVNGPHDLQNCMIRYQPELEIAQPTEIVSTDTDHVRAEVIKSEPMKSINNRTAWLKPYISAVSKFFGTAKTQTSNYLIGNQEFIKITGPRNLLIQSDTNYKLPELPVDTINESLKTFKKRTNDYINIATIQRDENLISKEVGQPPKV